MTRPHQIEESLKSLRLSGMLETLDARLPTVPVERQRQGRA